MGTNVRLAKIDRIPPEVGAESSRSPPKSESWNNPNLLVLSCITHMTPSSLVIREMKKGYQTSFTSVTSLCPLFECSCSLFTDHRMSGLPMRASMDVLRADFRQFSHRSQVFLLNWWSSTRCGNFTWLLDCVCQFAVLFNAFLCMSFYVVGPRNHVCTIFSVSGNFSGAPAEIGDSNIFLYSSTILSFGLHSRWVHPEYTWSNTNKHSQSGTWSHQFSTQKEQPVLQCWTMMLATCVVVDISRCLDTLTREVPTMLEHPPLWLGCKRTLRRLLVLHILVDFQ